MSYFLFLFFIVPSWFILSIRGSSSTPNPLNGQHLRVIWTPWNGNPKGLIGPVKGGLVLEILSKRLNFTYEMIRVLDYQLGPLENGKGLFNYLIDQRCDLLVHDLVPTSQRNQIVDLTLPWAFDYFAFLFPAPDETANINSVVKPFQWQVWLGLGVSIFSVIAVLNLIQHFLENRSAFHMDFRPNNKEPKTVNLPNNRKVKKCQTGKQYLYVFGILISQGGFCPLKWLPYRLVAGVWTLAAFFFVQSYTSILFTYVVTPIYPPLINSVYDIIDNGDINLYVREYGFLNILFKTTNETGLYTALRKRLDSFPNSRCASPPECTSLIKPGSRNVFAEASVYLRDAIRNDFQKTGKCNLQIAKESFINIMASFALPKNSPYTQSITQGILEQQQIGLIDYWYKGIRTMPPQCDGTTKSGNKKKTLSPLSLKNLSGAFIFLSIGLSLSFSVFLGEKMCSWYRLQQD